MAFHKKIAALEALRPDVAVIPECADLDRLRAKAPLFVPDEAAWVGDNPNKGLGVFAFNGYHVRLDECFDPALALVAPIHVSGPVPFRLLAVWSFNFRGEPARDRRPGPIQRALADYEAFIGEGPLVAAGDFNNHVVWDRPGKVNNQAAITAELEARGLVSAYHADRGVSLGDEPEPTHYWRDRKMDGPSYHIDYVFIPREWQSYVREMTVGSFEDWCGNKLSDHVPLVVEVDL